MVHRYLFFASAVALALFSSCVARPQRPFEGRPFFPGFRRPFFPPFQPGALLRPPAQFPIRQPTFQAPLEQGPLLEGQAPNPLQALPGVLSSVQQAAGSLFGLGGNILPSSSSGSGPLSALTSPLQALTSLFSGSGTSPLQTLSSLSSLLSARSGGASLDS